jgi:UDP-GlcNAc:undecaprenyl-phosphate GlcNAc-1-phosphate transferase
LTLPLLDVVVAIARRWLTGRSLFTPDRGHIHHCLGSRLGSTSAALVAAVGLAILGAGGAVTAKVSGMGDLMACPAMIISVGLLVFTKTFGESESRLLLSRTQAALTPLLTGWMLRRRGIRLGRHLHGIRDWERVWDALIREVETGGVRRMELAVDMAAAGESYHGRWSLPTAPEDDSHWSVVHTLYAGDVPTGTLRVAVSDEACQSRPLGRVEELVRVLEGQLGSHVPPPSPSCANLSASAPLT